MLGCWDVPSCIAVRQDALKWSRATWSWEPPRGRAWLFTHSWHLLRVVCCCLSLPEYLTSPPCLGLSLGSSSSYGVLECLRLSLCVAEWEVMLMGWRAAGHTSNKALVGATCLHDRQLVYLHGAGNRSPTCFSGGARALGSRRVSWPMHQSEPGRPRARQRLVVRGGDFSCEAVTSRGNPSCRELIGDAANWPET
jgi:hypothetical protein